MDDHPKNILDFNYIADGIYIGTNQCCQMHFDELLRKKEGITADISLEEEKLDMPFGVDFYTWLPVEDHKAPQESMMELGVSVLENLVAMKKKVYVHCKNGHGRAPTLVAAYLIKKGMTAEEAIRLIKEKRPAMHLSDEQTKALKGFEKQHS
jgi:protein-tyrosine phosphatase